MIKNIDPLEIIDWGLLGYESASLRQQELVAERLRGEVPDRLILVEHPPTVTIGRSGTSADLLLSLETLLQLGVVVHAAERGGKVTYHGPGQLVAYPVIELRQKDLHWYVQALLESVAILLRDYGLHPVFKKGEPGIWVNGGKIASIGVAVKKWVSFHGIALNVNPDMAPFGWIVPCGNPAEQITSIEQELGHAVDIAMIKTRFSDIFRKAFGYGEALHDRHPDWLKIPVPIASTIKKMEGVLSGLRLETVCQSAHCPNLGECFGRGTATFMILGGKCTRECRFCAVSKGHPEAPDPLEPVRVAQAAKQLGLQYVVITSVTRDDLDDGGAGQFVKTIENLRAELPGVAIEILVPDFQGDRKALEAVIKARPEVFNHNLETVPRLYSSIRPQANYGRSLDVLRRAAASGLNVKTGLMLGLGEQHDEVIQTLLDLREIGCEYLTMGQYLAPSSDHVPVVRYLSPDEFSGWSRLARGMGFKHVASGPLIRSSYRAGEIQNAGLLYPDKEGKHEEK